MLFLNRYTLDGHRHLLATNEKVTICSFIYHTIITRSRPTTIHFTTMRNARRLFVLHFIFIQLFSSSHTQNPVCSSYGNCNDCATQYNATQHCQYGDDVC